MKIWLNCFSVALVKSKRRRLLKVVFVGSLALMKPQSQSLTACCILADFHDSVGWRESREGMPFGAQCPFMKPHLERNLTIGRFIVDFLVVKVASPSLGPSGLDRRFRTFIVVLRNITGPRRRKKAHVSPRSRSSVDNGGCRNWSTLLHLSNVW